jgi:serine/threonine protein kinase
MMTTTAACFLLVSLTLSWTHAFVPPLPTRHGSTIVYNGWTSDFDDFLIEDDNDDESGDPFCISNILQKGTPNEDLSACQARQFSLGQDLVVTDFAGSMGFDEVTDWEYYYESEDGSGERNVVPPPPLDPSKPKRTRQKSGSVIRIFRGRFEGTLGATLRSQGLDPRLVVKEFSGKLGLELARNECKTICKLQSKLVSDNNNDDAVSAKKGDWIQTALARSVLTRKDNANVAKLLQFLSKAPFCGILGQVNLAELEDDMEPNEFYRALGVAPPKSESIWIVYEYTGLSTVAAYSQPALARVSRIPLRRGPFGNVIAPPALPSFKERSRYVIQGIIKGALEAVALLHESGIVHGSIGRSSLLLSSVGQDKTEASSVYATNISRMVVKLADFGFSKRLDGDDAAVTDDPAFSARAKSFGLIFYKGESSSSAAKRYAMAEDFHALGFVVLALLLTSLAQVPTPEYKLPDEDTLQRLLTDIFEKDMQQFREYVQAEDVWSDLVELLDEKDEAWEFLESLLFARERVANDEQGEQQLLTARGLLSSPFLQR